MSKWKIKHEKFDDRGVSGRRIKVWSDASRIKIGNSLRKYNSLDNLLNDLKSVHGNQYDYSKVELPQNLSKKITIICKIHGEFSQSTYRHLQGMGCKRCGLIRWGKLNSSQTDKKNYFDIKVFEELYKKGLSKTQIAKKLNVPRHSIYERLKKLNLNEKYRKIKFEEREYRRKLETQSFDSSK